MEYPLGKLLVFTEHKDTIRRGGVATIMKSVSPILHFNGRLIGLRNCAFQKEGHIAMLSPDSAQVSVPPLGLEAPGIDMLPYLLLPLAGPEEFDLDVCLQVTFTEKRWPLMIACERRHKSFYQMLYSSSPQLKGERQILSFD